MQTVQGKEGAMMSDFERLIKTITNIEEVIQKGAQNGLKQAGARIMGTAKSKLGIYQPSVGEYPAWKVLSPQSVRAKFLSKSAAFHINGNGQVRINITNSGKRFLNQYGRNAKVFGGEKQFQSSGTGDDSPLVDTGALRRAITMDTKEIEKGNVYIGVSRGKNGEKKQNKNRKNKKPSDIATYGAAHEYGSAKRNIPPRPYLRPSVVENKEQIAEDIKNGIAEMMSNFGQGGFLS